MRNKKNNNTKIHKSVLITLSSIVIICQQLDLTIGYMYTYIDINDDDLVSVPALYIYVRNECRARSV